MLTSETAAKIVHVILTCFFTDMDYDIGIKVTSDGKRNMTLMWGVYSKNADYILSYL